MNGYADNIEAVTAQEIQSVAKKYFVNERKTVAYLTPLEQKSFGAK